MKNMGCDENALILGFLAENVVTILFLGLLRQTLGDFFGHHINDDQ